MEMDFSSSSLGSPPWGEWPLVKGEIKDGVKREVGVDGVPEGEEIPDDDRCLRFTHGSASCLLSPKY